MNIYAKHCITGFEISLPVKAFCHEILVSHLLSLPSTHTLCVSIVEWLFLFLTVPHTHIDASLRVNTTYYWYWKTDFFLVDYFIPFVNEIATLHTPHWAYNQKGIKVCSFVGKVALWMKKRATGERELWAPTEYGSFGFILSRTPPTLPVTRTKESETLKNRGERNVFNQPLLHFKCFPW